MWLSPDDQVMWSDSQSNLSVQWGIGFLRFWRPVEQLTTVYCGIKRYPLPNGAHNLVKMQCWRDSNPWVKESALAEITQKPKTLPTRLYCRRPMKAAGVSSSVYSRMLGYNPTFSSICFIRPNIPQGKSFHWSIELQNCKITMLHWAEKLDRVDLTEFILFSGWHELKQIQTCLLLCLFYLYAPRKNTLCNGPPSINNYVLINK